MKVNAAKDELRCGFGRYDWSHRVINTDASALIPSRGDGGNERVETVDWFVAECAERRKTTRTDILRNNRGADETSRGPMQPARQKLCRAELGRYRRSQTERAGLEAIKQARGLPRRHRRTDDNRSKRSHENWEEIRHGATGCVDQRPRAQLCQVCGGFHE